MSLAAFHGVFITLAALGAFGFAAFAFLESQRGAPGPWALLAAGALVLGTALVAYGRWAFKKHSELAP